MGDLGPGVLACATPGGGRSEAGHCFHLLFFTKKTDFHAIFRHGQRSVAEPGVFPSIGPGVLACATRGGGRSEAGHCFHLLFSSSFFFFSSFFLLRLLLFTHIGETPVTENLFRTIF